MVLLAAILAAFVAPICLLGAANEVHTQADLHFHAIRTPITKVIELLEVLEEQVLEDNRTDTNAFTNYSQWYESEKTTSTRMIQEQTQIIASASVGVDEQEVNKQKHTMDLDKAGGELAKAESDLQDAKDLRDKERKAFEVAETVLVNSADSLERSLSSLRVELPSGSGGSSTGALQVGSSRSVGFMSMAKKLQVVLAQGADVSLTAGQREILKDFLRRGVEGRLGEMQDASVSFLQVESKETGATDGVISTLEEVLEDTENQLQEKRNAEQVAGDQFRDYEAASTLSIDNKKKTMAELKVQIAQCQQKAGQLSAQSQAAQELLKVTQKNLDQVETEFVAKSHGFKERNTMRSEELLAVQDALSLLTSDTADALLGPNKEDSADDGSAAATTASLLQISGEEHAHRSGGQTLRGTAGVKPMSFLEVGSHRSLVHAIRADPFGKIKAVVRDMLQKMQTKQAEEAKKAAWCDSEMHHNKKSQSDKQETLQKVTNRVRAMDEEIAQLTNDLKILDKDVADMEAATTSAETVRQQEAARATTGIQQAKDAQLLVTSAIHALNKFYGKSGSGSGAGRGVIGILEIALQDYADLQEESEKAEAQAQNEFKDFMTENAVRKASFDKDVEYKTRNKVKLEGDRMRASDDAVGVEKELQAVATYLEELDKTCVAKGDSYETRKVRREAELESLREAHAYLSGQAVA